MNAAAEWLPRFETVTQPLALADLILLADCFYLPYAEGPEAKKLLTLVDRLLAEPVDRWGDAYELFCGENARIQALFDRLTELRDRELFDAWSRRAWELKEELQVIAMVLAQKKTGHDIDEGIRVGEPFAGNVFRGGFLTKLKRFLEIDAQGRGRGSDHTIRGSAYAWGRSSAIIGPAMRRPLTSSA